MARPPRPGTSGTYTTLSVRLSHRERTMIDALRTLAYGTEERPAESSGVIRALIERAFSELPEEVRSALEV